jgi:DNA adenine methylase
MNAVLKYPGSKWTSAEWITSYFPPHNFYLEPFFGSGAVLFTKQPAKYETVNDMCCNVVNFFKALREYPEELANAIYFTPWARDEFNAVQEERGGENIQLTGDCIEDARRFAVRCMQSMGNKLSCRSGWKNTKHASGGSKADEWNRLPEKLLQNADRLKNAQIENTDAIELIEKCNGADCLIYADPPYLKETRQGRLYRHEMLHAPEHEKLLQALLNHKGYVVLSGYDNDLYNDMLTGWSKDQRCVHNTAGSKTTETIWMNYDYQIRLGE